MTIKANPGNPYKANRAEYPDAVVMLVSYVPNYVSMVCRVDFAVYSCQDDIGKESPIDTFSERMNKQEMAFWLSKEKVEEQYCNERAMVYKFIKQKNFLVGYEEVEKQVVVGEERGVDKGGKPTAKKIKEKVVEEEPVYVQKFKDYIDIV